MNIVIVNNSVIPALKYGGTERVIWWLGKELSELGHRVTFLVNEGSVCPFATVQVLDITQNINSQIPKDTDVVHFHFQPLNPVDFPYIVTMHGNLNDPQHELDINTVFVSKNHAKRFNSTSFVYNGLNWDENLKPAFDNKRTHFHFLGKAAWRIKNVQGAINIVRSTPKERLKVLGGTRLNLKMGFRFTTSHRISFYGMIGGIEKDRLLAQSKGLIFPVRWHEPFGLAIIESLYYGCPIFGTPYGSLPELITTEVGFLANSEKELTDAILLSDDFDKTICHQYAADNFNSVVMTNRYLKLYEQVLNGYSLNNSKPKLVTIQEEKFLPWLE